MKKGTLVGAGPGGYFDGAMEIGEEESWVTVAYPLDDPEKGGVWVCIAICACICICIDIDIGIGIGVGIDIDIGIEGAGTPCMCPGRACSSVGANGVGTGAEDLIPNANGGRDAEEEGGGVMVIEVGKDVWP